MKLKPALVLIALGIPALFGRTTNGETVRHGEFGPGSQVPEESAALCEELPDDVEMIPGLTTGWAVAQEDSGAVRLIFSDIALACENDADSSLSEISRTECISGWSYSYVLPAEVLVPGSYNLADYAVDFREQQSTAEHNAGCSSECAGSGIGGGTAPSGNGPDAVLEIYSVSDECITGRLTGLDTGQISPPPPELNGAFHAVRCSP